MRFRHKRPPLPRKLGVLSIYSGSPFHALDRKPYAPWPRTDAGPLGTKNMRQMFLFQADQVEKEDAQVFQAGRARSGAGCRIRERVIKEGPDALGSLEHLSVLLGEHEYDQSERLGNLFRFTGWFGAGTVQPFVPSDFRGSGLTFAFRVEVCFRSDFRESIERPHFNSDGN